MTPQEPSKPSKSRPLNVYTVLHLTVGTRYMVVAKNTKEAKATFLGVFYRGNLKEWEFKRVRTDKSEIYRTSGEVARLEQY